MRQTSLPVSKQYLQGIVMGLRLLSQISKVEICEVELTFGQILVGYRSTAIKSWIYCDCRSRIALS